MDGFAFVFVLFCFLLPPGRRNYDFIVKLSDFVFFARVCVRGHGLFKQKSRYFTVVIQNLRTFFFVVIHDIEC